MLSSSSSAAVRVDKATSDLLIAPDWALNMEICDSVNSNHWLAKDVVKAVKKRLQHKSSTVQLLALTLLETMVKNCGDYVHFQIVDRNILQEMVKLVRKKGETNVRNKVLVLLDSWQEAFGGAGGKYPQYYWTYEELRRSGVQFPKRSQDAAPVFTPPVTHPPVRHAQPSYGMPSSASRRLDEAMASEIESLSLSSLDAMGRVAELLTDMLRAVTPSDREAVKDELIVDLVAQCRSNQKRLMQMLTSTGDEELLARGLELNDNLQSVLAKHDAIASGLPPPMHNQIPDSSSQPTEAGASSSSSVRDYEKEKVPELAAPNSTSIVPVGTDATSQVEDEDDEEDDFALLARRHSKHQDSQTGNTGNLLTSTSINGHGSPLAEEAPSSSSNALVLADPPPPVRTTKDLDMIDFLSLALTTTSPHSPAPTAQSAYETPVPPTEQTYPGQVPYNNYVAPWAQPQPLQQTQLQQFQPKTQPQPFQPQTQSQQIQPQTHLQQIQPQTQPQPHLQQFLPQPHPHPQQIQPPNNFLPQQQHRLSLSTQQQPFQPDQLSHLHQQQYGLNRPSQLQHPQQQAQSPRANSLPQSLYSQNVPSQASQPPQRQPFPQTQMHLSSQYPQSSPSYIPPPWAATPGYYSNQRPTHSNNASQNYGISTYTPTQPNRPQQYSYGSSVQGDPQTSLSTMTAAPVAGQQKPFIPSYRLFEDLDVFGNTDGRAKGSSSGGSPSLSGGPGQGMVGRNK